MQSVCVSADMHIYVHLDAAVFVYTSLHLSLFLCTWDRGDFFVP